MTEPQTWTVIGGFLTAIFAMLSIVTTSFHRTVRSEVGALRSELTGELGSFRAEVAGEIGSLRTEMRSELRRIDTRLDHLDRDVQALTRHVFGRPE